MGWDQRYCKNYQIPFPMTIHGSKLELKQLRYPENCAKRVKMLPKTITFYLIIRFPISSVFWKLDIQSFPEKPRSAQSKSGKSFKYAFESRSEKVRTVDVSKGGRWPLKGRWKPKSQISIMNTPRPLILQKEEEDFGQFLGQILSLFLSNLSPKCIQTPLILLFSPIHKVVFLHSIFLSLVPYLRFEVQGCGCSFLATIHDLFFSQLFLVQ